MIFCDTWNFGGLFGVQILDDLSLTLLMVYLWSTWWFTIWCVIQSGPVFFVGQAAYELG